MPEHAKRGDLPLVLAAETIVGAGSRAPGRAARATGGPARPARFA
jgi:hypothetical protein